MIIKSYHIIKIDITQIIDCTLDPILFFPILNYYTKGHQNGLNRPNWTEVDQSRLKWTKEDQIGLNTKL